MQITKILTFCDFMVTYECYSTLLGSHSILYKRYSREDDSWEKDH